MGVKRENIEALVNFVTAEKSGRLSTVRTSKKDLIIPGGQAIDVSWDVNIGPLDRKIPVLFNPNPEHPWPHGIELSVTYNFTQIGMYSYSSWEHQVTWHYFKEKDIARTAVPC